MSSPERNCDCEAGNSEEGIAELELERFIALEKAKRKVRAAILCVCLVNSLPSAKAKREEWRSSFDQPSPHRTSRALNTTEPGASPYVDEDEGFVPPNDEVRRSARRIPLDVARRLGIDSNDPCTKEGTTMVPHGPAEPGSWLHEHEFDRRGQTVGEFAYSAEENQSLGIGSTIPQRPRRRKIMLLPLDGEERSPFKKYVVNGRALAKKEIQAMKDFLRIWLQFPEDGVIILEKLSMDQLKSRGGCAIQTRTHTNEDEGETYLQFDLVGILANLEKIYNDCDDAYAVVGFSPSLLYYSHTPSIKYYEGLASMAGGAACFSFFSLQNATASLRRGSFSTICHEVSHTFGMRHCVYYDSCYMRGSATQEESDGIPLICCPVCLNKLKLISGNFSGLERYRQLKQFYHKQRMYKERDMLKRRIDDIVGENERPKL